MKKYVLQTSTFFYSQGKPNYIMNEKIQFYKLKRLKLKILL